MVEAPEPTEGTPEAQTGQPLPGIGPPEKAGAPARMGTGLLALLLAFGAAVMIVVAVDIGDTPVCSDFAAVAKFVAEGGDSCFDGSEGAKTASTILAWGSGVVGALAALLAFLFTIRGRGGRPLAFVTVAAVALGVLSIVVGSV